MNAHNARISLFIIAKNEERNIAKCIANARSLVNEIIVVDSFSKDRTVPRCRELGAQVFQRKFDTFTNQKNFALSKVTSEWALSLDADEFLTPACCEAIKKAVTEGKYDAYLLTRVNDFLGKRMKHSRMKKEYIVRLARTHKAKFYGKSTHEQLATSGTIGRIDTPFVHHPYDSLEKYLDKFNHYTTAGARTLYQHNRHTSIILLLLQLPFDFLKRYLFDLGFLDGVRGLIWAVNSTCYTFVKYMKLWQLEQQNNPAQK